MIKRLQTTIAVLLRKGSFLSVDSIDDPDWKSASDAGPALRDRVPGACLAELKLNKANDPVVPRSPNGEVRVKTADEVLKEIQTGQTALYGIEVV